MFNSIRGIITGKNPQKLFIETNGVEWDITVPDTALDALPPVGSEGKVYTWMQHTDTLMNLFGFASVADRELFFDLLKVEGIGPKGALKIMSNISSSDLAHILDSGDVDSLQKVPGVGKKTAAKMLLQLKGKLTLSENSTTVKVEKGNVTRFSDIISGLVGMGYDRKKVEDCISAIDKRMESEDSYKNLSDSNKEPILFRQAIVELAQ